MKQLFVNQIIAQDGVTHGVAGLERTVRKNLYTMYSNSKVEKLLQLFAQAPEGAYFFDQFCQYVVYVQHQPVLGLSMKISDFHKDTDLVLEEYSNLRGKGWKKEDTDKIMKICQAIEVYKGEQAELVIKDPVP